MTDILDPGSYHMERKYGDAMREARARLKEGRLADNLLPGLDQVESFLEDGEVKLAHERTPETFRKLQDGAAHLLQRPLDKLLFAQIDPVKTRVLTFVLQCNKIETKGG